MSFICLGDKPYVNNGFTQHAIKDTIEDYIFQFSNIFLPFMVILNLISSLFYVSF